MRNGIDPVRRNPGVQDAVNLGWKLARVRIRSLVVSFRELVRNVGGGRFAPGNRPGLSMGGDGLRLGRVDGERAERGQ